MIERTSCRVCDGGLRDILSLGSHHVSDFVLPGQPDGQRAPLDLVLCTTCHLLQLRHTVPGDLLYRNYWYRSGTNATMRNALADIAEKAEALTHLVPGDAVLDIGCNDGTLLAAYRTPNLFKTGFDPARNLSEYSRKVADHVVVGYFGADTYRRDPVLTGMRPKIVTSIAMFYDLEEPRRFVADVRDIMHPDGVWIVQMSYLPRMLEQNEIGNVCHEHLEYYSLRSFEHLLELEGLKVVDLELNDVNGGSLRAYVRHRDAAARTFADRTYRTLGAKRVDALREQEAALALDQADPYLEFARWVERIRDDIVGFVREQRRLGKTIYVYGASTKGNTVLQYYGLDATLIAGAAERNPDKWGRVTVGTRIPIVSEAAARAAKLDFFLVLPWHFLREFQQREHAYLSSGGRFIVPAPHFTLI